MVDAQWTKRAEDVYARLLVTGLDENGKSVFVADDVTPHRYGTDAFTVNQMWQAVEVPTPVMSDSTLGGKGEIPPPSHGYTYVITAFPPDSAWEFTGENYARALAEAGAGESVVQGDIPGLHQTDTIDIVTVISGEIWSILEGGEKLLQPGDTLVQRGTRHAWQNRGDVPAVISAVHVSVVR